MYHAIVVLSLVATISAIYEQELPYRTVFKGQKPTGEFPEMAITGIAQMVQIRAEDHTDGVWFVISNDVHLWNGATKLVKVDLGFTPSGTWKVASAYGTIVAITSSSVHFLNCSTPTRCVVDHTVSTPEIGAPMCAAAAPTMTVWVGSSKGLYQVTATGASRVHEIPEAVRSVAWNEEEKWAVAGTNNKLWQYRGGKWFYDWAFNLVEGPPSSFAWGNGYLWIGNDAVVNAQHIQTELFERLGAMQGLPYRGITTVQNLGSSVWFGHANGTVSRYYPLTKEWRLYSGDRWVVGDKTPVVSMLALDSPLCHSTAGGSLHGCVLVATEKGFTAIELMSFSLAQKAALLEIVMKKRHDRYGLAGSCRLKEYGNTASWEPSPSDNNGLWTSIYIIGLALKYNVTKSETDRQEALYRWKAIQSLMTVTGIKGYMARSLAKIGDPGAGGKDWHNSTTMPGYQFKGDTSSDEVVGHMMAHAIVYDLVAQTGPEKEAVYNTLMDEMLYITNNNWQLVGVNGKPTRWGKWDPTTLNTDPFWFDERGLNSLQIITWTVSAIHYSRDETTRKTFEESLQKLMAAGYGRNILNQKVEIPNDVNHSDDELAGGTYVLYGWLKFIGAFSKYGSIASYIDLSWTRNYKYVDVKWEGVYNALNFWLEHAAGSSKPTQHDLDDVLAELQRVPLEYVDWPFHNSDRIDLFKDNWQCRQTCATVPIPPDENGLLRWNTSPFQMDGGSGFSEVDTGNYLMMYWMGRYLNMVSPTD